MAAPWRDDSSAWRIFHCRMTSWFRGMLRDRTLAGGR
jgi:hypothetical protein